MKRIKLIFVLSLMISLFFSVNLHAKGKTQKIRGQAKVDLRSANLYAQQKNTEKALGFYLKVIDAYPDHVESLFNIAGIYNNEALEEYDKADELYAKSVQYYKKTLEAIESIPNWKEYEHFSQYRKESIRMIANQWSRVFKDAFELYHEQKYDESEAILFDLKKDTPDSLNIYQLLAAIEGERGNKDKQLEYFGVLLEKNPNDEKILINIADQYYQAKEYQEAISYFERLATIAPTNTEYLLFNGICYLYLENKEKALEIFEQVLVIDPNNIDALANASYIVQAAGNDQKAIEYMKKLYQVENTEDNLTTLCYQLAKVQNWTELIVYAKQWRTLDSGNKEPVQLIILAAGNLKDKALQQEYTNILKKM